MIFIGSPVGCFHQETVSAMTRTFPFNETSLIFLLYLVHLLFLLTHPRFLRISQIVVRHQTNYVALRELGLKQDFWCMVFDITPWPSSSQTEGPNESPLPHNHFLFTSDEFQPAIAAGMNLRDNFLNRKPQISSFSFQNLSYSL